jgi:ribonuclease E
MEMSRQRIRTSVLENSTERCPECGGTGHVRSVSSVALQLLRGLEEALMKSGTHNLLARTRPDVAIYVLNHKRAHLRSLEERFHLTITVSADENVSSQAPFVVDRGEQVHTPEAARALAAQHPSVMDVEDDDIADIASVDDGDDDEDVLIADAGEESQVEGRVAARGHDDGDEETEEGGQDERGPRRKRRRRRGRRGTGERTEGTPDGENRTASEGSENDLTDNGAADDDAGRDTVSDDAEVHARSGEPAQEGEGGESGDANGRRRRRGRRGGRRGRRDRGDTPRQAGEAGENGQESIQENGYDNGSDNGTGHDNHHDHGDTGRADAGNAHNAAHVHHHGHDTVTPDIAAQTPTPPMMEPRAAAAAPTSGDTAQADPSAPRRRSTIREAAPVFGATTPQAQPDAGFIAPVPAQPSAPAPKDAPASENDATKPRKTGWWSRTFAGG